MAEENTKPAYRTRGVVMVDHSTLKGQGVERLKECSGGDPFVVALEDGFIQSLPRVTQTELCGLLTSVINYCLDVVQGEK